MKKRKLLASVASLLIALNTVASADVITTTFAFDNIGGGNWTNLFDLTVLNPNGIRFEAFTVNVTQAGAPFDLDVYVRSTSYVGFENTTVGWTLASMGSALTGASTGPVLIDVADFDLNPGTYGFALVNKTYQVVYLGGSTDYSNLDLLIDTGAVTRGPLTGQVDANRVWNGSITYEAIPEPTTWALLSCGAVALFLKRRKVY